MDSNIVNFNNKAPPKLPDDLMVLAQTYALSNLKYIAITQQEHLVKIMNSWPLLAELAQVYSESGVQPECITSVNGDSNTASTQQFADTVELRKKSNE